MDIVEHHGVHVDACTDCGIVWFDPEERRASTKMPLPPRPDPAYAEQLRQEYLAEREAELARRRAGKGAHKTDNEDIIEAVLHLLTGLLS
jgi:Zn-finger nucleic acid-binding protein